MYNAMNNLTYNETKVNLEYKALHGFYWMLYCLTTGYTTVLLLSHGFSSSVIGVIAAVSNILAAVGQLAVGNLTDKCSRVTWKNIYLMIGALEGAALAVLAVFKGAAVVNAICFPLFTILMYLQMPLVNSAVFHYTSRGLKVDFGSARGMGSLTYAFISFVAGQLIVRMGESVIIYLSILVTAGMLLDVFFMPCAKDAPLSRAAKNADEAEVSAASAPASAGSGTDTAAAGGSPQDDSASGKSIGNILGFAGRYPDFMLVLAGSILLMSFHNIGHTYMIQIMEAVGGNSATMGTAFSIEAIMELPVMFGFYKLIKKVSADNLMIVAGAAFTLKALTYLLASSVTALYLAQILQMFSNAIFILASVYYADKKMAPEDKVTGQSYMTASISIGAVLGNFLGGQVLNAAGLHLMLLFSFLMAAAGTLIVVIGVKAGSRRGADAR